jgi:hypothetical protein
LHAAVASEFDWLSSWHSALIVTVRYCELPGLRQSITGRLSRSVDTRCCPTQEHKWLLHQMIQHKLSGTCGLRMPHAVRCALDELLQMRPACDQYSRCAIYWVAIPSMQCAARCTARTEPPKEPHPSDIGPKCCLHCWPPTLATPCQPTVMPTSLLSLCYLPHPPCRIPSTDHACRPLCSLIRTGAPDVRPHDLLACGHHLAGTHGVGWGLPE